VLKRRGKMRRKNYKLLKITLTKLFSMGEWGEDLIFEENGQYFAA
jgi:hypothetical protein